MGNVASTPPPAPPRGTNPDDFQDVPLQDIKNVKHAHLKRKGDSKSEPPKKLKKTKASGGNRRRDRVMSHDEEDQDFIHTPRGRETEGVDENYAERSVDDEDMEVDEEDSASGKGRGQRKRGEKLERRRRSGTAEANKNRASRKKYKLSEKSVKVDYETSITEKKEEFDKNVKEIARLAELKNLGKSYSNQKASIDELVDHLEHFGAFDMKNLSAEVLKNQVKKFLEDPLKRDYSIRAILLFMETINESWFSELSSMEFITKEQQATTLEEGRKNLEIGAKQLMMGCFTGAISIGAGFTNIAGATQQIRGVKNASSSFKETEQQFEASVEENQHTITQKKTQKQDIEKELKRKDLSEKDKTTLTNKKDKIEKDIGELENDIRISKDKILNARSAKDTDVKTADMNAQRYQAMAQIIDSGKSFVEGALNYSIALTKNEIKILEAIQTGLQFENAKLKMCMQRSFDFVNSVWGVASSIINSYYQTQKAIVSS